jgi:hypothetical protein
MTLLIVLALFILLIYEDRGITFLIVLDLFLICFFYFILNLFVKKQEGL